MSSLFEVSRLCLILVQQIQLSHNLILARALQFHAALQAPLLGLGVRALDSTSEGLALSLSIICPIFHPQIPSKTLFSSSLKNQFTLQSAICPATPQCELPLLLKQ